MHFSEGSFSLRASSPIWVSEVSLASLAQIGELARRLGFLQCQQQQNLFFIVCPFYTNHNQKRITMITGL